jgi:Ran GTPase-activating protein (RanGAP) involved in mRNA processing and transport
MLMDNIYIQSLYLGNHHSINKNKVVPLDLKLLTQLLDHNHFISILDMRDITVGNDGMEELSLAFKRSSSLISLNLSKNDLGVPAMKCLVETLKET